MESQLIVLAATSLEAAEVHVDKGPPLNVPVWAPVIDSYRRWPHTFKSSLSFLVLVIDARRTQRWYCSGCGHDLIRDIA